MGSIHEAARPPDAEWKFAIGQCVSHRDLVLPALVRARASARQGRQIYSIRSFAAKDDHRDRMILGDFLRNVAPGSEPCTACLLFGTGICPSR